MFYITGCARDPMTHYSDIYKIFDFLMFLAKFCLGFTPYIFRLSKGISITNLGPSNRPNATLKSCLKYNRIVSYMSKMTIINLQLKMISS